MMAYTRAAHEYDEEGVNGAGDADHPRGADEKDHAEDVLHARQKDAEQGAQLGLLLLCKFK